VSKRINAFGKVGELRTRRQVGQLQTVLLYRDPHQMGIAERMMAMPDEPKRSGQFFFNGSTVYFHKDDEKYRKFIVYESVEQVQRTVGKATKVRLRP
jgi:hypothetical protein